MRRIIVVAISLLFFSSAFSLISYIPVSSASAPNSSSSSIAYINSTLSGFQNSGSLNQQTLTITAPAGAGRSETTSANVGTGTSWSTLSNGFDYTYNFGSYRLIAGKGMEFQVAFYQPVDSNGVAYTGTIYANETFGSTTYSLSDAIDYSGTSPDWVEIDVHFNAPSSSQYDSVSLKLSEIGISASGDSSTPEGFITILAFTTSPINSIQSAIASSEPSQTSYGSFTPWTYSSTNSNSYSPSMPAGSQDYQIIWTSQYASYLQFGGTNEQSGTSGTYDTGTGSSKSILIQSDSNPHDDGGVKEAANVLDHSLLVCVIVWVMPVVLLMVVDADSTVFSINSCAEKDGLEGSPTADSVEDVGRELV